MATLLIIGGSGFFGKSILDSFQRGGLLKWNVTRIIVISRNATRLLNDTPSLISSAVELINLDITTTKYLPNADFVIHAAASTDARNYVNNPLVEGKNIIDGISNYCELSKKYHKNSKIVFASSGAIYGIQPPNIEKIEEDYLTNNLIKFNDSKFEYAIAKQKAELLVKSLGYQGLSVSIARCFAFIGPWLPRDQHFAIGNFINDALKRHSIIVNTNINVYRSYMFADDLVEWLMAIANSATNNCPTYNVGSDKSFLLTDVARKVASFYGLDVVTPSIAMNEIDRYVPSIAKAENELGLNITIDLDMSIKLTINQITRLNKEKFII